MLVANSFAGHYVQYAPDNKELAGVEKTARELKLGLWADGGALNEIVSRRLVRQE
jgi:endonuclease YncB( thermonuclease family)